MATRQDFPLIGCFAASSAASCSVNKVRDSSWPVSASTSTYRTVKRLSISSSASLRRDRRTHVARSSLSHSYRPHRLSLRMQAQRIRGRRRREACEGDHRDCDCPSRSQHPQGLRASPGGRDRQTPCHGAVRSPSILPAMMLKSRSASEDGPGNQVSSDTFRDTKPR